MEKQLKPSDWCEKSRATWQKNKSTQSPECFTPTPTWVVWEAAIKYSSFLFFFQSARIVLSFQRSERRVLFSGTTLVLSFTTKLLSKDIKVTAELDTWELVWNSWTSVSIISEEISSFKNTLFKVFAENASKHWTEKIQTSCFLYWNCLIWDLSKITYSLLLNLQYKAKKNGTICPDILFKTLKKLTLRNNHVDVVRS